MKGLHNILHVIFIWCLCVLFGWNFNVSPGKDIAHVGPQNSTHQHPHHHIRQHGTSSSSPNITNTTDGKRTHPSYEVGEEDKLILRTTPIENEKQPPPLTSIPLQNTTPTQHKNNSTTIDVGLLLVTTKQNSTLPPQIYVAVCSVESNGISTLLSKKNECPSLPSSESTGAFVSLFPNPGDDLDFNPPQPGTIFNEVLDETRELEPTLIGHEALYRPGNQFEDQMNLDKVSMTIAGPGTYYVVNHQNPNGKFGRATQLKSTKTTRYPDATTAVATVRYDSLPGFVLSDVTNHLNGVYDIVSEDFNNHGGLQQFLLTKTFEDAVQWEEDSGGMSILSVISLHMIFDPSFGGDGHYNKLLKPFHLNQMESTQQLNSANHGHGEKHEHFYSNLFHDFVITSDRQVETSAQHFGRFLEKVTGKHLSELTFKEHIHSASWAPGLELFSHGYLNMGLLHSAELLGHDVDNSSFGNLPVEDRRDIVDHFGGILDCDLSSVADQSLREIANEAFDSCRKTVEDFIYTVTEIMYDTLTGKQNSQADGKWFDPFQRETDREHLYDPKASYNDSDNEYAREVTHQSVRDFKAETDICVDASNVHYKFMDTNNQAYSDVNYNLEDVLLREQFKKVDEFYQVNTFVYQSPMNTESGGCCIAVVFLHSPFYRALESRPPYVATSFSLEDWQTQSDAAVSFHYLHTVSLTFRGVNAGFETPKGITGTILPAFSLRAYVSWRLHYGDLRVGTLLAKALLLGERGNRVLDKPLMRLKTWNEFCRRHGEDAAYQAISFLDRLFFYISTSRDDEETIVNEVYSRLVRQNSNRQKYIDSDLKRLRDDYFKVSSHLMSAITTKHDERPPAKKKWKNISNRYGNN